MRVPDEVYHELDDMTDGRDMTMKEAIRLVFREAGRDV